MVRTTVLHGVEFQSLATQKILLLFVGYHFNMEGGSNRPSTIQTVLVSRIIQTLRLKFLRQHL